ncbi:hypothetical protein LBMAG56_22940 [Verrucomicrobiota bacterium]|nr:hypothetical protein LBMAG56_22940 [Verrucomicrobiota bacterium]
MSIYAEETAATTTEIRRTQRKTHACIRARGASQFFAPLISTRLQPGVAEREESGSRFNGFGGGPATLAAEKTAKAVVSISIPKHPAEAGC